MLEGDTYDYLVVCTGVKLDWGKVAGLAETIGKNGVCSNYSPEHVTYTWDCLQRLKSGSRAVFTQPPLPIQMPGCTPEDRLPYRRSSSAPGHPERLQPELLCPRAGHFRRPLLCTRARENRGKIRHQRRGLVSMSANDPKRT